MFYGILPLTVYRTCYPLVTKVICRDSAAAIMGLTSKDAIPLLFYYDQGVVRYETNISNQEGYYTPIKVNNLKLYDTIELESGVWCTNEEQTICDMLAVDGDLHSLCETIANYYFSHRENLTVLQEKAKTMGLQNELERILPEALVIFDES